MFRLVAGSRVKGTKMEMRQEEMCQLYYLPADNYLHLVNKYPRYRNTLMIRSEIRNLYFRDILLQNLNIHVYRQKIEHKSESNNLFAS